MKRFLALVPVLLLAVPLGAEERAKETAQPAEKAEAAKKTPQADSPLVAAAKRSKRGTSKSIVITDETVKSSTGRLTTTDSAYNPPLPPAIEPSPEVQANAARAAARAAEEKKAAEMKAEEAKRKQELARKARLASEAEQYEEGYDNDMDPARLERQLAEEAASRPKP